MESCREEKRLGRLESETHAPTKKERKNERARISIAQTSSQHPRLYDDAGYVEPLAKLVPPLYHCGEDDGEDGFSVQRVHGDARGGVDPRLVGLIDVVHCLWRKRRFGLV